MSPIDQTLRSPAALAAAGLLAPEETEALVPLAARYAVAVTPAMARLVAAEGRGGPIARQFVPTLAELAATPEERADPIGDEAHAPVEGVVHRYPDRALLKLVHSCPVYCRFCFRREMVGPAKPVLAGAKLDAALAYIAAMPSIWEVVLTGGDPFMLSARRARELTRRIAAVGHVKALRWHTRVPMVDPSRVTPGFARALVAPGLASWVAIHANHPREFTPEARQAIDRLACAGVALVSQSVLLKGVNDDVATLEALMRLFVECGVKPYYLHHPDLAPGTSHFRLPLARGQALVAALRQRLSGLALPSYVLDIPGGRGKVPVGPDYLVRQEPGERLFVRDTRGALHAYPDAQEG